MTLGEILKIAFSDAYSGLTFAQTVIIVLGALMCAAMICVSYRLTFRGALFSRSFCASLFTMCLITTLLIMAVRTNVYLSLGTLGALSVMAVRKMLEACAGSRPTARKIRGMLPPASAPSSMSPMSAAPMTMPSSGEEEVNQTPTQASIAMITPEAMPILPSRNTAIHARLRSNFSVAS